MKPFRWDPAKDKHLRGTRSLGFTDVLRAVLAGQILDDLEHADRRRYPGQRIMIVEIDNYAYVVPYVESESDIFWKTIIPSRKMTRKYLRGG